MFLLDYKVRVVNSEAGTAARIRVNIESSDGDHVWGTIGVSENLMEASWLALIDAVEYKLALADGGFGTTLQTAATANAQ
jgi:2-isopropylmalate synthase